MATPWLTSDDIIESVKRKISMPIAQNLFSEEDILKFANEEMAISQIPSILQMHEEYLVTTKYVRMQSNQGRYPIPDRAIGMKLRDLFWQDDYGNIFQMSQITEEDKAFFQRSIGANQAIHKYYVEGNDVVLAPTPAGSPTGLLMFVFFLRPNQLVRNSRAATVTGFSKYIEIDNVSVGDIVTIDGVTFTATKPVKLQVTIGSPPTTVFSSTTPHGFYVGDKIRFTTPAAVPLLPSGLLANTTYYVIEDNFTSNTFSVSLAPNGTATTVTTLLPDTLYANLILSITNSFEIADTSINTAANLAAAINANGVATATSSSISSIVTVIYPNLSTPVTSSSSASAIKFDPANVNIVDNKFVFNAAHGFPAGANVKFATAGTLPAPLSENNVYTVSNYDLTSTSFSLSNVILTTTGDISMVVMPSTYYKANVSMNFEKIITPVAHGFSSGDMIQFETTGTYPTGLEADKIYYVINTDPASTNFQISESPNGAIVNLESLGTGVLMVKPVSKISINAGQGVVFNSIPSNIADLSLVDFLQTKPGHKIRQYGIVVPNNGISGNIINFNASDVPADLVVGDYVCSENECIIPQIPPDLHTGLAERTSARILAAMGDVQGLQMANEKIGEIEKRQGTLLDSRVDGSPRKITNKYSLLRWGRLGTRRRF